MDLYIQIRHIGYNECHNLFACPSVCSSSSLNSFFFLNYNATPVVIYSAILSKCKTMPINTCMHTTNPLAMHLVNLTQIHCFPCVPAFLFYIIINIDAAHKRSDLPMFLWWKNIFSEVERNLLYLHKRRSKMRTSQMYTGEEMNKSLFTDRCLFFGGTLV